MEGFGSSKKGILKLWRPDAQGTENIQTGFDQLDDIMSTRTKAIQRKLRSVETLKEAEAKLLLPEITDAEAEEEDGE